MPNVVIPIAGELLRFEVFSRSRAQIKFLVDLEENDGFGFCSCEDFEFHVYPALQRGENVRRCWHLKQTRNYLLDKMIAELVKFSHEMRTETKRNDPTPESAVDDKSRFKRMLDMAGNKVQSESV